MKTELLLDGEGIDIACEEAAEFLAGTGMSKREMIAGRLSFENVLLIWQDHYGDDTTVTIEIGKRFGRPFLTATVRGDRFDPRGADMGEKYTRIAQTVLETSGLISTYP